MKAMEPDTLSSIKLHGPNRPWRRLEDEHDHEDDASAEALAKEDLVADLGVSSVERLRRETSTSSVESLVCSGDM